MLFLGEWGYIFSMTWHIYTVNMLLFFFLRVRYYFFLPPGRFAGFTSAVNIFLYFRRYSHNTEEDSCFKTPFLIFPELSTTSANSMVLRKVINGWVAVWQETMTPGDEENYSLRNRSSESTFCRLLNPSPTCSITASHHLFYRFLRETLNRHWRGYCYLFIYFSA